MSLKYLFIENFSWCSSSNMFSKKKKKPAISLPSNFQHRVHTGYDNSSNKFVGLPKQWASLVEDVAGSASQRRPQPVIDPSTITPTDMLDLKVKNDSIHKLKHIFPSSINYYLKTVFLISLFTFYIDGCQRGRWTNVRWKWTFNS